MIERQRIRVRIDKNLVNGQMITAGARAFDENDRRESRRERSFLSLSLSAPLTVSAIATAGHGERESEREEKRGRVNVRSTAFEVYTETVCEWRYARVS